MARPKTRSKLAGRVELSLKIAVGGGLPLGAFGILEAIRLFAEGKLTISGRKVTIR